MLQFCEAPGVAIVTRCLRDAFTCMPATDMCTLITCHAIFLVGMLGFRYTEPSIENECNFNEINSTN